MSILSYFEQCKAKAKDLYLSQQLMLKLEKELKDKTKTIKLQTTEELNNLLKPFNEAITVTDSRLRVLTDLQTFTIRILNSESLELFTFKIISVTDNLNMNNDKIIVNIRYRFNSNKKLPEENDFENISLVMNKFITDCSMVLKYVPE